MDITNQTFIRGVEIANGRFVVCTQAPGLDIETQPHTGLVYWSREEGWTEIGLANGVTADATTNEDGTRAIVTDPLGLLHEPDGDTTEKGNITDADGFGPEDPLRCIRRVGNKVFAAGVDRAVFVRNGGAWTKISTDEMVPASTPAAFQGLDGRSASDIYTAGWDGELWHYDGTSWRQLESPTNIVLNDICCSEDSCVAVGMIGQIVMGRGDSWDMVSQDETEEDFWSVRFFQNAFYLASLGGIYRLKDGELTMFRERDPDMRTAYALSVGPSGLWSIGSQDIALFDGNEWTTIGQS